MLIFSWKSDRGRETLSNIDAQRLHRLVLWLLLGIHLSFSRRHLTPRSIYTRAPAEFLCVGYTSDICSPSSSTSALREKNENENPGEVCLDYRSQLITEFLSHASSNNPVSVYVSAENQLSVRCKRVPREGNKSIGVKSISLETAQELSIKAGFNQT